MQRLEDGGQSRNGWSRDEYKDMVKMTKVTRCHNDSDIVCGHSSHPIHHSNHRPHHPPYLHEFEPSSLAHLSILSHSHPSSHTQMATTRIHAPHHYAHRQMYHAHHSHPYNHSSHRSLEIARAWRNHPDRRRWKQDRMQEMKMKTRLAQRDNNGDDHQQEHHARLGLCSSRMMR